MKTRTHTRTALITAALMMILFTANAFADVQIDARININSHPRDLQIWIWPDRGEGSSYFPGETIYMNVEATRDCFLILYDIDTRGNMRILFPYDPWDDNFVRGGEVVTFPRDWDGYEWTVDGPEGVEYVQAIASEFPINPPDWPIYMRSNSNRGIVSYDRDLRDFRASQDRLGYIDIVNRKICGRYYDYTATDLATFYVQPRYYRPINISVGCDPWPDIFYGEIYIAWPIGGRIFIDGVFVGVAPCWIPRTYYHSRHVITCYDGRRLVREQTVHYYPKSEFRYKADAYRKIDVHDRGYVKSARRGGVEVYRSDVERGKVTPRPGKVITREQPSRDREYDRGGTRTPDRARERDKRDWNGRDSGHERSEVTSEPAETRKPSVITKPKPAKVEKKSVVKVETRSSRSDVVEPRPSKKVVSKSDSNQESVSKMKSVKPGKSESAGRAKNAPKR